MAAIRGPKASELQQLIPIYRNAFPKHNVFQLPEKEVHKYLLDSHKKNKVHGLGYLAAIVSGEVAGALLLKRTEYDTKGKHWTVKINHLAVHPNYRGKGIGSALVKSAEKKLMELIKKGKAKTIKVEVKVSENEAKTVDFFRKHGFRLEGRLKSHFRAGELVHVLGKEL